ncbi:MAG: hypothetical protein GF383_02435 [Candidatus Lokiarchaeota archaeon]|nr:hypothetical protein [Candidatus Lokiarchaeota archaeon]MBD3338270.1 hypothetical protein [Candidatus Lokiarchaeota archaeon]
MISKVFIIAQGGVLLYSKDFLARNEEEKDFDEDLISGFLTAISNFAQEIKGGGIQAMKFKNFNFIYSADEDCDCMFVAITDIEDIEDEAREKVELMKKQFIQKFESKIKNFTGCVNDFDRFDEFTEKHIYIPPKVLLVGEDRVGKTTIMNLFPGDTVLKLDEDLNEIIEKDIELPNLSSIKAARLREINLQELVENSKIYRGLLNSVDVICIVTNSAASNLGRTKRLYKRLKKSVNKADFYIIANFQDLEQAAFEPNKIEESFDLKTFEFSGIEKDAKEKFISILTEIIKVSVVDKIQGKYRSST